MIREDCLVEVSVEEEDYIEIWGVSLWAPFPRAFPLGPADTCPEAPTSIPRDKL